MVHVLYVGAGDVTGESYTAVRPIETPQNEAPQDEFEHAIHRAEEEEEASADPNIDADGRPKLLRGHSSCSPVL